MNDTQAPRPAIGGAIVGRPGVLPSSPWASGSSAAIFILLVGILPSACGYSQEVPALPAAARSIAVGQVANLTGTGELDVRLRGLLQKRLRRHAHVAIVPAARSDLLLSVQVAKFSITRVIDPAVSADRSFGFRLSGRMTLTDQRNGKDLIANKRIAASVGRLHSPTVRESPAIRDEGVNDVLDAFAAEVEKQVLQSF